MTHFFKFPTLTLRTCFFNITEEKYVVNFQTLKTSDFKGKIQLQLVLCVTN